MLVHCRAKDGKLLFDMRNCKLKCILLKQIERTKGGGERVDIFHLLDGFFLFGCQI